MQGNNIWIILGIVAVIFVVRRFVLPRLAARNKPEGPKAATTSKPRRRVIKNRSYVAFKGLTIASLKMYFRNRTAIFFSLFFPMVFITVFGLIFKNNGASFKIDVVDQSKTTMAAQFEKSLKTNVSAFKITDTSANGPRQGRRRPHRHHPRQLRPV